MSDNLEALLTQALHALANATDLTSLDDVRVHYLGKKGVFTAQMKELGRLEPDQRREAGQVINQAKEAFQDTLDAKKIELEEAALLARLANERIDVTLAGRGQKVGGLHPVTTHCVVSIKFLLVWVFKWLKAQKLKMITIILKR